MKKSKNIDYTLIALVLLVGASLIWTYASLLHGRIPGTCIEIPKSPFQTGTQGYRTWANEELKSFEHHGKRICIPEGYEALGEKELGDGYALFPTGQTGVVIRSDAFLREITRPEGSAYEVEIIYPQQTPEEYRNKNRAIIENAFSRVSALFPSAGTEKKHHTVLITALLAGNTVEEGTRVYPDPSADITMFVRTPDQPRAEELVVHAIMHLHNRYRADLTEYKKNQLPFAPEDFEEMEATWAETAFLTWPEARVSRLQYLHRIHVAVRTKNFSLISAPPFNNEEEFMAITESVVVPFNAPPLDYQYNHYVLAPLSMVAIEGLFARAGLGGGVEEVLAELHKDPSKNFLEELEKRLGGEVRATAEAYLLGKETIPFDLVLLGAGRYE